MKYLSLLVACLVSFTAHAADLPPWSCLANGLAVYASDPANLACDIPYKCFQFYRTERGDTSELAQSAALKACETAGPAGSGFYPVGCQVVQCTRLVPPKSTAPFEVIVQQSDSWGGLATSDVDTLADNSCEHAAGLGFTRADRVGDVKFSNFFGGRIAQATYQCRL